LACRRLDLVGLPVATLAGSMEFRVAALDGGDGADLAADGGHRCYRSCSFATRAWCGGRPAGPLASDLKMDAPTSGACITFPALDIASVARGCGWSGLWAGENPWPTLAATMLTMLLAPLSFLKVTSRLYHLPP
jgi:hypothetical protein